MLTHDELFLHTLDDLERRVPLGRGEYDALMSAWLLRKLLLDPQRLIDLANGPPSRQLEITFEVADIKFEGDPHGWLLNGGLYPDPRHPRPRPTVVLSRDAFLARPTLRAFGETYTVKDLIRFMAHIAGAVHVTPPSKKRDRKLWDFVSASGLTLPDEGHYSAGIHDLAAIGKIVLDGLNPLRQSVEADLRGLSVAT